MYDLLLSMLPNVHKLGCGQAQTISLEDGVEGLINGITARGAITTSSRGNALSLVARDEGATRVTRLGTRTAEDHTENRPLAVVNSDIVGLDRTASPPSRRARAADSSAHWSSAATTNSLITLDAVSSNIAWALHRRKGTDVAHVQAGKVGPLECPDRGTV